MKMLKIAAKRWGILFVLLMLSKWSFAQEKKIDGFETKDGWNFIKADGVDLSLSVDNGHTGKSIRFDYDFTKGTGYGGIQKIFHIDLPENFEFTFYLKADSPGNNLEIKFLDSTGNNVWWVNNRNYDFPKDWKKIIIKKRHISFAWGPTNDLSLRKIDRIEFTIASFTGGKGTVWLDDLKFEPLPPETHEYPKPLITASSAYKDHSAAMAADNSANTYWQCSSTGNQYLQFDFRGRREFGGLQIDWLDAKAAKSFDILTSPDAKNWENVYTVSNNQSLSSFIRLPEAEAKFLKISLKESISPGSGFGIREVKFLDIRNSLTPNDFLIYTAHNSTPGNYPRYFLEEASFWTITGVNNDVKESLINEDGMVETDKGLFSIEPMIKSGDTLFNWCNVTSTQSLGPAGNHKDFEFVPTVTWKCNSLKFETGVTATGDANKNSVLQISYAFQNRSDKPVDFEFYLLLRPFQVNPYYQFLNLTGGAGKIKLIREEAGTIAVDDKVVIPLRKPDAFGACNFDEGNVVGMIREGKMPPGKVVEDIHGMASGVMKYSIHLSAGETTRFYILVPYYGRKLLYDNPDNETALTEEARSIAFWQKEADHIKFNLPASADRIINTYKSNLVYILVNRDKAGIQPGSRSYERSWIRDGALTSSALLKSGIVTEVKDFIDWYAAHQYENGKVPCVVDSRGPDPVPENDSHGEMIYLIREYFNFTHDTTFLCSKNEHVMKACDYIEALIAQRSTDYFKNGNDSIRSLYGLVPESISHEGYSAKPMHSYWDDFFTMKGLKDAAEIQHILGKTENYKRICRIRDTFRDNLYHSIELAMKNHQIDYIPGCAELGDFDATSTTIALTPCNELKNLPKPQVYNTFEKYYTFFKNRRDGNADWINYTPYENRLIGSFIMLDQPGRAHELIDFFLHDQHPQGWNHWAEVVWKDYRTPKYIGDMPHTWCGSDFLNAVRSMFVYENEYDQSLVLASALYQDWIDAPEGMSVENLPTYYGEISFSVKKDDNSYRFRVTGDLKLPVNGIKIRNFNGSEMPSKVVVNGKPITTFSEKEITVQNVPADIVIYY